MFKNDVYRVDEINHMHDDVRLAYSPPSLLAKKLFAFSPFVRENSFQAKYTGNSLSLDFKTFEFQT